MRARSCFALLHLIACAPTERSEPAVHADESPVSAVRLSASGPAIVATQATSIGSHADHSLVPVAAVAPHDRGIFDDLPLSPPLQLPAWLSVGPIDVWRANDTDLGFVLIGGVPVGFARSDQPTTVHGADLGNSDTDGDRIPDTLDILLGARKVAANGAAYHEAYRALSYPGGDVSRDEGVCTDVVVRALRNAGIDLQKEIHDDVRLHPRWYEGIKKPDTNIDQRRVKNVWSWFRHHWQRLDWKREDPEQPLLPGDVLFFDTLPAAGPDHLGVVSDRVAESGYPLIVNNWTDGYHEDAMDLLPSVEVTDRFRAPNAMLDALSKDAGLEGLATRNGLQLDEQSRQALVVTAATWEQSAAELQRFERSDRDTTFRAVGVPIAVRLGSKGLGWGRGIHPQQAARVGPTKSEGDRRSPAGIYALGVAFGPEPTPPKGVTWPWRQVTRGDVFVDDPASHFYNQWPARDGKVDWQSSEDLTIYKLGLVVEHNPAPSVPGAGSAIFVHSIDRTRPTTGCTGLGQSELTDVLGWLKPEQHPVLIQLPGAVYLPATH